MLIVEKDGVRTTYKTKENDILPTFVFATCNEVFKDWSARTRIPKFLKCDDKVGKVGTEFRTHNNGDPTSSFKAWRKIMKNYTVCDEWLDYPEFHRWFLSKSYAYKNEKISLDVVIDSKDSIHGFSPDTALLLPKDVIAFFDLRVKENGLPKGIIQRSSGYNVGLKPPYKYAKTLKSAIEKRNKIYKQSAKELLDKYDGMLDTEIVEKLKFFKFAFGGVYGTYIG